MPTERNRTRSQEEWFELVTVARKSGLTDSEWCRRNQISLNTFHNAIRRLKNNSYEIPEQKKGKILDLCSPVPMVSSVLRKTGSFLRSLGINAKTIRRVMFMNLE